MGRIVSWIGEDSLADGLEDMVGIVGVDWVQTLKMALWGFERPV